MLQTLYDFDKYIYHYTTAQAALMYIIPSKILKFSTLNDMNDPKENKTFGFGDIYSDFEIDHRALWAKVNFESFLKRNCKLICFSGDYKQNHNGTEYLKFGYDLPTMWAHYADKYKGICLVFDKEELLKEIGVDNKETFYNDVNYQDLIVFPPINPALFKKSKELYFANYIIENIKPIFFQKFSEWDHEHEKRIVHIGNKSVISIQSSLKGIVLGSEISKEINPLLKLVIDSNLCVQKIIINDGRLFPINYDLGS